jgi:hypothetical protein
MTMASPMMSTLDGGTTEIDLSGLADALGDALLTPESDGYDEARTLWNAMIDRRPTAIVGRPLRR